MTEVVSVTNCSGEKGMVRSVRRVMTKAFRCLGLRNHAVEVYVVGDSISEKNILAYPAPRGFPRPDYQGIFLGEIIVNPRRSFPRGRRTLAKLLVHALLHLMGYDHRGRADILKMKGREKTLARICNSTLLD